MADDRLTAALAAIKQRNVGVNYAIVTDGPHLLQNVLASQSDVPRLLAAVEAVLDFHKPFGIYDECDCGHTEEDVQAGTAIDTGMYYACEEMLMYRICTECCTVGMEQTEDCATSHKHGKDLPFCRTYAAISDALLGEDGNQ